MVLTKAKLKGNEDLAPWIQSITNHLWWCTAQSKGDEQKLREMWLSILQHITNKHRWGGNKVYHKCSHGRLSADEQKKKKWLKRRSEAFKTLQQIVTDKRYLKDMLKLSLFCHTGDVEVYHSMKLKYCPKRKYFPYESMKALLMLAALDWNLTVRILVKDSEGNIVYNLVYCKRTKKFTPKKRYKYEKHHVALVMLRVLHVKHLGIALPPIKKPKNLSTIATVPKPDIKDVKIQTRF